MFRTARATKSCHLASTVQSLYFCGVAEWPSSGKSLNDLKAGCGVEAGKMHCAHRRRSDLDGLQNTRTITAGASSSGKARGPGGRRLQKPPP